VRSLDPRRSGRALLVLGLVAALGAPVVPAAAASGQSGETRRVAYRGVSVTVPSAWPVHRMDGAPGCVRLDRHAVYLGDPSRSTCPPHVVGRTGAVHLTTGAAQGVSAPDLVVRSGGSEVTAVISAGEDPAGAREIADSVTFGGSDADVLAPSGRSAARSLASSPSSSGSASGQRSASAAGPTFADTTYTGLGFDACTAPSLSQLSAWYTASPYKAVNIYIGGASRGCQQPNLTASWVDAVVKQGWVLIPTYVGLQASCRDYPNRIDPAQAAAQGRAGADDAVVQLNALGLGVGNPVYFDMEAFAYSNTTCRQGVLDFLDAWTARLHEQGYVSGLYGSANSTIRAVVSQLSNPSFDQPDQLWIARWCPEPYSTSCDISTNDPEVPADKWADHQRIRQYRGGHKETWGGVTINIDNNNVDAAVAPSSLAAEGAFVSVAGSPQVYRIAGGAPVYVSSWESVGLPPQPVQTLSPTQFDSLPFRPKTGTFVVGHASGQIYRVAKGIASHVPSWTPYGGPKPTVTVDQAALDNAGTGGVWNHLLSGTPSVRTTGPTTRGTTNNRARFTYAGGISSSAVRNYDVRWRRARWDGSYEGWKRPATWQRTTNLDAVLGMRKGWTYCVSVRARNRAGQRSGWSGPRCHTRALDDRRLTPSSGWKARKGDRYYAGTVRHTKRKNATLTRSGAKLKRVGIVATTCRRCGKVAVLVDGRRVGRINLKGDRTRRRQVLMLPAFKRERGTVTIRVRSRGLKVQIDGLVTSRS
jgi:hypothetical protein